jgi:hypothetical protein
MPAIPKGFSAVTETFPMPPTRKDRVAALDTIMNSGGVQRLSIELGKGIRVLRLVKDELEKLPKDMADDTTMASIRNVEMLVSPWLDSESILRRVFNAFKMLQLKGAKPFAFVTNSVSALETSVESMLDGKDAMFGIPVIAHKSVPDDVLLLVGAHPDDLDEITLSIKIDTYQPKGTKK